MKFNDHLENLVNHRDSKLYNYSHIIYRVTYGVNSGLAVRTFVFKLVVDILDGLLILECLKLDNLSNLKRLEVTEKVLGELE